MFKILLCRMDRTSLHGHQRDSLHEALKKIADVTIVTNSLPADMNRSRFVKDLFNNKKLDHIIPPKLPEFLEKYDYDFIFLDCEISMFYYEPWSQITTPKIATLHDLHTSQKTVEIIINNGFDIIINRYKNPLYKLLPDLKKYNNIIYWQPGCVNIDFFKDYNEHKKYDVTMTGKISKAYPLRQKIKDYFKSKTYFNYIGRPKDNDPNAWPVNLDYAKLLNQSKICLSTGSRYNYPLMKNYEITASKSMLMLNDFKELSELGFYDKFNFVSIDENMRLNEEKILEYLNNDSLRHFITMNGYTHTREKHNSDYRAKEFINILCDYKNINFEYPEIGINQYSE